MGAVAVKQSSNDTTRKHKVNEQIPGTAGASIFSSPDIAIQSKPSCPCGGGCPRCRGSFQAKLSSGRSLDIGVKSRMESAFGLNFSDVRVHTDSTAANISRRLDARAFTFGNDIAFGAGEYQPGTLIGDSIIAHELAHVIQQGRGRRDGAFQSVSDIDESNELAANQAALEAVSGHEVIVKGTSSVGIACAPRSLEVSLDPSLLSFTELENEINEIQQHLDANPVSSNENDHLMKVQDAMRKELAKRRRQEEGSSKRKTKSETSVVPRSLTESLRIDETMPDMELNGEIDAIHAFLGTKVRKEDRANLRAALTQLEAEKQRRQGVAAAQARAEKIKRAFSPKVTSTDGEALIEVMGIIESIRQSETASGLYTLVRDGELLTITKEEYDKIKSTAQKTLRNQLFRVRQKYDEAQNRYNYQKKINEDQYIVSGVIHFFGGIDDPGPVIAQNVRFATVNADAAAVFIERGQLKRAAEFFANSEKFATIANKTSYAYVDELISTGETTVTVLEITRDAAFATELALGAVVAAPVVAAGASGLGLTGAGATVFTAAGTGTIVGAEGALLRGGSAAGGVALAGGSNEEVLSAAKSEGWRGFKEGFSTGVGGGVAHTAGTALKVGQSTSKVVNIARGSAAQGLGGAAGSATGTALEGGSVTDVAKSGAIGFGIGTLTGPLSEGAGLIKSPVVSAAARTGVGAVASGGQTYLETGDKEAAFQSAAIGGTSSLMGGMAKPSKGTTPAQQKAFELGQVARSKVKGAARTVRNITAATALGLAEAVPPVRGTGATVGDIVTKPVPGFMEPASVTETIPTAQPQPTKSTEVFPETPAIEKAPAPVEQASSATKATTTASDIDVAFVENAEYQVGTMKGIGRVRTTASGRQLISLESIQLTPSQREAVKAIHGQQMTGNQQNAWQNTTNQRELNELANINRLWNQGTDQSRQQARDLAREAFNRHRARYWAAVRADPNLRATFEAAGMRFTGGNTAAPVYDLPDGTRARMTLEHSVRLADDPVRALSGNNLQFVLNDENSVILEFIRANDPFQRR